MHAVRAVVCVSMMVVPSQLSHTALQARMPQQINKGRLCRCGVVAGYDAVCAENAAQCCISCRDNTAIVPLNALAISYPLLCASTWLRRFTPYSSHLCLRDITQHTEVQAHTQIVSDTLRSLLYSNCCCCSTTTASSATSSTRIDAES